MLRQYPHIGHDCLLHVNTILCYFHSAVGMVICATISRKTPLNNVGFAEGGCEALYSHGLLKPETSAGTDEL
jgi:hypothetical protein